MDDWLLVHVVAYVFRIDGVFPKTLKSIVVLAMADRLLVVSSKFYFTNL